MPLNPPDINELKAIVDWVNLNDDVRELSLRYGDVELFISRNHVSPGVGGGSMAAPAASPPVPVASPASPVAAAAPVTQAAAAPVTQAAPVVPQAPGGAAVGADDIVVKAPMVGTFYSAPKPGAMAFVEVGARVEVGAVLGIVEVMKLMNNLEAPAAGVVARILVENNQTVEYGQPLFVIRADG